MKHTRERECSKDMSLYEFYFTLFVLLLEHSAMEDCTSLRTRKRAKNRVYFIYFIRRSIPARIRVKS